MSINRGHNIMKNLQGFTLVEMAIVLAIIALILGSGLTLLSAQQDQRRIEDVSALLSSSNEALIGYALSHTAADGRPYLPCPDRISGASANDGIEDRTVIPGPCSVQEGNLPWVTLSQSPQTDAWSNRLRYRVTAAYSNSSTGIQLTPTPSAGDINVYDSAAAASSVVTAVPAVILSHGKNGLGATNAAGINNPAATSADEQANTDGTVNFVSRSENPTESGYFDDQLIWLSPNILFNRMVQAGKLP